MRILLFCLSLFLATAEAHDMSAHWKTLHQTRGGLATALASDSTGAGKTFSAPVRVNAEPETVMAEGQNRPQIAVLESSGQAPVVVVAWVRAREKVFASEVRFARSVDGGVSFEPARTLNDDGQTDIGHSFVALAAQGAQLTLAWIDARASHAARTSRCAVAWAVPASLVV